MEERFRTFPLVAAPLLAAFAGCSAPDELLLYEHHWSYGPGYPGLTDEAGHPRFLDRFNGAVGGRWVLHVASRVAQGTYEVALVDPDGNASLRSSADGWHDLHGRTGFWTFEIRTDADGNATPAGRVDARLTAG